MNDRKTEHDSKTASANRRHARKDSQNTSRFRRPSDAPNCDRARDVWENNDRQCSSGDRSRAPRRLANNSEKPPEPRPDPPRPDRLGKRSCGRPANGENRENRNGSQHSPRVPGAEEFVFVETSLDLLFLPPTSAGRGCHPLPARACQFFPVQEFNLRESHAPRQTQWGILRECRSAS